MQTMNMPGFTAEASLYNVNDRYPAELNNSQRESEVVPAFRVTCPGSVALGATCTILGAPAAFFPCFGNSGCMWFHAGLANPACFTCSFV
jgi:hypothetical protein